MTFALMFLVFCAWVAIGVAIWDICRIIKRNRQYAVRRK